MVAIGQQQPRPAATNDPAVSYADGLMTVGSVSARSQSTTAHGHPESSVDFRVRDLRVKERRNGDDALVQVIDARRSATGCGSRSRLAPRQRRGDRRRRRRPGQRHPHPARLPLQPGTARRLQQPRAGAEQAHRRVGKPAAGPAHPTREDARGRFVCRELASVTAVTISVMGELSPAGARSAIGLGGLVNVAIGTAKSAVRVASSPVVQAVNVAQHFGATAIGPVESGGALAGRLFGLTPVVHVAVHRLRLQARLIVLPIRCDIAFVGRIVLFRDRRSSASAHGSPTRTSAAAPAPRSTCASSSPAQPTRLSRRNRP